MKKLFTPWLSALVFMALTPLSQAAWYEVTGSSAVVASEEQARTDALEDAIYKAVSFAGADIGSISNLRQFLQVGRKEYQFSNHEVHSIIVEREQRVGNTVAVVARINIYPSATGCHISQYKKTFSVGNIDIGSPQQAVMGQIYDIGDDFAQVLNRQLDTQSSSFISVGTTEFEISKNYPERLKMIAQDKGAQYLIGATINDLTATIEQNTLSEDVINRQFAIELTVFDGKTGNEVYNRNYRAVAKWPFAKTSKVDTKSARFWDSSYGEMLLKVSRDIMLDLESEISCKVTLPEIVAKWDKTITINLGRIHGVKLGDKLQLWHTGSFIDQRGIARNKVTQTDVTLTVSRVYENEAEVSVDQPELTGAIQIGDVMHKL